MSWLEIRTRLRPWPNEVSPIIDAFRDHGIENTMEDGDELVGCIVDVPSAHPEIIALQTRLAELGATEVVVRDLESADWENDWKKFFKPRRIGKRIVVRPTWEDPIEGADDVAIVLDPGQAFGTGDHPTTRGCLEFLDALDLRGKAVLDLGCGSGILAVAAKKLRAGATTAVDIDPISVDVTIENAARNDVEVEAYVADRTPEGHWDVVVSNIISATLIRLTPSVARALAPGGRWIVSGVIDDNWADVRSVAQSNGFALEGERHEDGWVAAQFARL